MAHRVFIDGQAGTTGLDIHARLAPRDDIELLQIDPERRKDAAARRDMLNSADVVILCLPDAAAREAVTLIDNPRVRIIDASTAHRTAPDWTYGLPELAPGQRAALQDSTRVSNPGCYPTGFLLAVRPLVDAGLLSRDAMLSIHAVSGYSGGGRQMVERYQEQARRGVDAIWAVRPYALAMQHKHLPEMRLYAGLGPAPLFAPSVGHYYKGMLVQVPLHSAQLGGAGPADVAAVLAERYADERCVEVLPVGAESALDAGQLDPQGCNDSNLLQLMVFGSERHVLLVARLDNLGKGAGGAAVQNLNLLIGTDELAGLRAQTPRAA